MHPRANKERGIRDSRRGRIDGRTQEIQRLIGRALRAAVVPEKLGERTIIVDCDVLDADGGTRTASITGGFVALVAALEDLRARGLIGGGVLRDKMSAISVGLVDDRPLLDLCYQEDSQAQVDLNVVATASGQLIEVQGTAEDEAIPRKQFDELLDLALHGIEQVSQAQSSILEAMNIDLKRHLVA